MRRYKHNLSNYKLASLDGGLLIPLNLLEVLPGDTVQQYTSAFIRVSPLVTPVMHTVRATVHHWYVPFRLLWEDWEDFITGGPDGLDQSIVPYVDATTVTEGQLADYLGLPPGSVPRHSALPYRAYALIWNEFYRDQDLQPELSIGLSGGEDTTTPQVLQNVCWPRDYFTTARPSPQKGPAVTVSLGTSAPVMGIGTPTGYSTALNSLVESDGTVSTSQNTFETIIARAKSAGTAGSGNPPDIYADLSKASGISVNDLREALAIQRYQEARQRYGSRYVEYLSSIGVVSSDARLQRPEYLGGGRQTLQFSEVLQTAEGADPVGTLRGHGIGGVRSNRYRRFIEEHGLIMTLLSIRPDTVYRQGIPRFWLKQTKEEFWQREIEYIGDQKIYNAEVYGAHSDPTGTFGWTGRYNEYRRNWSGVAGEFNSTLNSWHMARDFSAEPGLNSDFVKCTPTTRVFASTNTDQYLVMARNQVVARRLVSRRDDSYIF